MTLDLGFSNVLRYPPSGTAGIVVLRGPTNLPAVLRHLVETLVAARARETPCGKLWIVEPGRVRVHAPDEDDDR